MIKGWIDLNSRQANWRDWPFMTYGIIAICVVVFLVETMWPGGSTNAQTLMALGANVAPLVKNGQPWRLFTAMWLHIGFMHLLLNMVSLYYVGINLERIYGHAKFLLIYLYSGLTGNLFSYWHALRTQQITVAAGASTAIFGVFMATAVLYVTMDNPYIRQYARAMWAVIVVNLIFNLIPGAGVDIFGHLGGIIGGALAAFTLAPWGNRFNFKLPAESAMFGVLAVATAGLAVYLL
ncbi:membrane-associated serine protease [Lactobacillus selangorensis]|uniref:Membrane-associated serine protease n=1 Tax=Lactobacillus selangorensis TaxID=81857 RepID=A0A0R2FZN7_9LACO|nr:membrane-associated serine protease [Lactobacillus selangorensis]